MTGGGRTTLSRRNPGQNSRHKNPRELRKPPINTYIYIHLLLNSGGGPRCVTYFRGVRKCVTKCDRGRGVKIVQNSVTYFMDGPTDVCAHEILISGGIQISLCYTAVLCRIYGRILVY